MASTRMPSIKRTELLSKCLCISRHTSSVLANKNLKKSVIVSTSSDIFTNLAFEDWLYKYSSLNNHHVLMIWQNDPCVVIGRHQNPYIEANLRNLKKNGIALARRNSGGGTVFHDNGNLNLTFFTDRDNYNRKHNLGIITHGVYKETGVQINLNERDDLVINDCKVSGTAAKLGRPNAYHHCTLLVNANKVNLSNSLVKMGLQIETNASKSVPSKIMNLVEKKADISIHNLIWALGLEFMRTPTFHEKKKLLYTNIPQGFQYVNPSEKDYPGLNNLKSLLSSWDWIYGKTPKFLYRHNFKHTELILEFTVENSFITEIKQMNDVTEVEKLDKIVDSLKNMKFDLDIINFLNEVDLSSSDKYNVNYSFNQCSSSKVS